MPLATTPINVAISLILSTLRRMIISGNDTTRQSISHGIKALTDFPEQRAWNANVEPIGPEGADVLAPRYFNGRKMTIYGGSSEVQRGIMAKAMLGL